MRKGAPEMSAEVETYPDRDSWLKARRTGLGSSDAAAILGIDRYRGPLDVYAEKLGVESAAQTEAMEWGLRLQPVLGQKYAEPTGRQVTDQSLPLGRTLAYPSLVASLDFLVVDPERGEGVLETKTTSAFNREEWEDEPPIFSQVQVQHQLAVTGAQWGSLAVLIG